MLKIVFSRVVAWCVLNVFRSLGIRPLLYTASWILSNDKVVNGQSGPEGNFDHCLEKPLFPRIRKHTFFFYPLPSLYFSHSLPLSKRKKTPLGIPAPLIPSDIRPQPFTQRTLLNKRCHFGQDLIFLYIYIHFTVR